MSVKDLVFGTPVQPETGIIPDPRAPLISYVKNLDDQMVSVGRRMEVGPQRRSFEDLYAKLHKLASPQNEGELNDLQSLLEIPALKNTVESVIFEMGDIMLPPETLASLGESPNYRDDVIEALRISPYLGSRYNAKTRERLLTELTSHREIRNAAEAAAQAGLDAMRYRFPD